MLTPFEMMLLRIFVVFVVIAAVGFWVLLALFFYAVLDALRKSRKNDNK